ncbi:hypothetical protein LTR96_011124 [Exophiala xenobiotica]|nr:hypothetical protein LTR41_011261 [Exophiala xenobiotica]KAK5215785.1 hypothetical protein LTR72_011199 [Exophiala xenobiotica]KAK5220898.1 hypothetical protein LTR47_011054 [Exophiala xenobiotica]KAK5245541.1 hypothetical protein LTS06_009063 [Exophiala xenobiotica]KAK5263490.1 hypothetical protein LTR96_011124 [Exophiala xenobiotica]
MCDFTEYGHPSVEWLQLEATLPPATPSPEVGLADLKRTTNLGRESLSKAEMVELNEKVVLQDFSIPTRDGQQLEARTYRLPPPTITDSEDQRLLSPIYMHFHGGGFLFGTLQSEDAICSRIVLGTGVVVLNVNYRHTPEHTYPTAWNDAEDALLWLCNETKAGHIIGVDLQRVVIGGVSAGAYIAAALVQTVLRAGNELALPETLSIRGQVLMIPCLVFSACYASLLEQLKDHNLSSYIQAADAPILNMARKTLFNSLLQVEKPDPADQRLNPGLVSAEVARQLPPTTLGIAGNDPLRDEGLLYGKLLSENGVPININVFKGLPHGFRRFGKRLPASDHWDNVMNQGILWALGSPCASGQFAVRVY